jgi:hypothetical protein
MRTIRPLIALTVLAIMLGACSGGASSGLSAVGAPIDGGNAQPAAPTAAPAPGQDTSGENAFSYDSNAIGPRDDAKIIRTGTIQLEVEDVPQALPVARAAIVALGGYVGASSTSNFDDRPTAQITYRIPVDRWEEALEALRDLNGLTRKVVTEDTQAVEVTGQIIDLEARIKNLRASETALQGIAAKATRITDVLEVEARLTDVRGQIEQLTAQLTGLGDQAAYATLTASFNSPIVAVEAVTRDWEPGTTIDEAAASLVSILQEVAGAGIWFLIVWLPILLVLGLIGGVAFRLARRAGFGRRNSQTGWQPPSAPPPPPPAQVGATDA